MTSSESSFNPYLPPALEEEPHSPSAALAPGSTCYRDGEFLMARDAAILPFICPVTGLPAAPGWDPPNWLTLTSKPRWHWWAGELSLPLLMFAPQAYALITHRAPPSLAFWGIWPAYFLIARGLGSRSKGVAILCVFSPAVVRENKRRAWIPIVLGIAFLTVYNALSGELLHTEAGYLLDSTTIFWTMLGISQLLSTFSSMWITRPIAVAHHDGWFRVRNCHPGFLRGLPDRMGELDTPIIY